MLPPGACHTSRASARRIVSGRGFLPVPPNPTCACSHIWGLPTLTPIRGKEYIIQMGGVFHTHWGCIWWSFCVVCRFPTVFLSKICKFKLQNTNWNPNLFCLLLAKYMEWKKTRKNTKSWKDLSCAKNPNHWKRRENAHKSKGEQQGNPKRQGKECQGGAFSNVLRNIKSTGLSNCTGGWESMTRNRQGTTNNFCGNDVAELSGELSGAICFRNPCFTGSCLSAGRGLF